MKRILLALVFLGITDVSIYAATFKVSDITTKGPVVAGTLSTPGTARFKAAESITVHARYGFLDDSQINYGQAGTQAHASFDDNVVFSGTQNSDHAHSFQAYPHYGSSGTLARMSGFWMQPDITAGVITELSQFKASNPLGAGTISTLYGLYIDALTRGGSNYAIYTAGTTISHFGGALELGPTATAAYIQNNPTTGHFEVTPRTGYETQINSNIVRVGGTPSNMASIDNNADGNLYINARAGYSTKFGVGDIETVIPGKGLVLTNAAGTVRKRVRLNATGDGLIFEAP